MAGYRQYPIGMPNDIASSASRTTAAKRLHRFLVAVQKQSGANLFAVVPDVLGISDAKSISKTNASWDSIQALRKIANMIDDVQRELDQAPFDEAQQRLYSKCLPGIIDALSPTNMFHGIAEAKAKISAVDLNQLENIDVSITAHIKEKQVEESQFFELVQAVDAALAVLDTCGIAEHLAVFIRSQLNKIKDAVADYTLRGMRPIEDALASYMGSYDAGGIEKSESVPEASKLTLKRVLDTGQTVVTWQEAPSGCTLTPYMLLKCLASY